MTLRTALRLGRVSNLPTIWTNVAAGLALASGEVPLLPLVAVGMAMSMLYVGGMYLNDAFDREWDALNRPERPIPAGEASASEVFGAGFGLLASGVTVLAAFGFVWGAPDPWTLGGSGAVLAGVIVIYDRWHKRNPFSPLLMALCRALVYVSAALAVAESLPPPLLGGALMALVYLIGLTSVARQETRSRLGSVWPLALLVTPFVYAAPVVVEDLYAALLYVGFLLWVAYAVTLLRVPGQVGPAVVRLIAGIALLDALLIASAGAQTAAGIAAAAFALTLYLQRHVPAT